MMLPGWELWASLLGLGVWGWACATWGSRVSESRRPWLAAAVAVAWVAPVLVAPIAFWDACLAGGVGGLGVLAGGRSTARRASLLGQIVLTLVLAEVGARALLTHPTGDGEGTWRPWGPWGTTPAATACALAFPGLRSAKWWGDEPPPVPTSGDDVLHLGDSMLVFGPSDDTYGVSSWRAPDRFVARLDASDGMRNHLNAGVPGTSIDMHAALARRWLDIHPPAHVVLYHFAENDVSDLQRRYPCCASGTWTTPSGESQCATPAPSFVAEHGVLARVRQSPTPLVVQRASRDLTLVANLRGRWLQGTRFALPPAGDGQGVEDGLPRYRRILGDLARDLRKAGVGLTFVVLPVAKRSRGYGKQQATVEAVVAHAQALGVDVVNLFDAIGPEDGHLVLSDGYHLSAAGHQLVADRLEAALIAP